MRGADVRLAEAVGQKVLEWRGAEFLEFLYLIQERNALETLRELCRLNDEDKKRVMTFFQNVNNRDDIEIEVCESGITARPKTL
ncbi:hypothetical protein LG047_03375 [Methylocystis sp. WRRC1]|uniref:hypothetical protein n=1 Tax=Methylocystis sp. WRRC1 TaxID=1732014 RepID=UPI001D1410B0|nr:hypothetical protein [Methylocystis sp. WRRC1]MCC3244373.1 hypothetical protein [Methylocystis sp. WRRC1]